MVAVGGITNTGASGPVVGNVATTGHTVTGFPPGTITGQVDVRNAVANEAHDDAEAVWNMLRDLTGTVITNSFDGTVVESHGRVNISGATFTPGIYNTLSEMMILTSITLSGAGQ